MRTLWLIALLGVLVVEKGVWAQKPNSVKSPQTGLVGEYFAGPNFERKVMTRVDPQVDFNWNWQSPGPGVPREYFSVRWTGKLYAPTTGKYRFSATVDDGVRVWVNGRKVIDEWRKQDDSQFVGEIALNGRQSYDLRIEYYNDWKGSVISVFWELPEDRQLIIFGSKPHQVIPAKYLFRKPTVPRPVQPKVPSIKLAVNNLPAAIPRQALTPKVAKPMNISYSNVLVSSPKRNVAKPVIRLDNQNEKTVQASPATDIQTPEPALMTTTPIAYTDPVQPFTHRKAGEVVVLQHVVFAQSEYTLLPGSYAELDKLVQLMQADTTLRIEIAGHTDNVGDKRLNQSLSEHRAKVVASYLNRHGIADGRITAKGYGGSRPIADNADEAQRAQNRRVEFIVAN